jgi:2-oxoglutarate ferredoxin oxidoreductase subunit delta
MTTVSKEGGGKVDSEYWREPLDKKKIKIPHGRVFIIPERCKQCDFCIEFCPREVLEESDDINAKGYHYPRIRKGAECKCIDCGFCTLICPEFAIYTEEMEEADDETKSKKKEKTEVAK